MGETNQTFTLGTLVKQDNLGNQISEEVEFIYIKSGSDAKVGDEIYGLDINNSKKGKSNVYNFPFVATINTIRVYSYVKSLIVSLPLFGSREIIESYISNVIYEDEEILNTLVIRNYRGQDQDNVLVNLWPMFVAN